MLLLLQIQQHHRDLEVAVDVDPVVDKRTGGDAARSPTLRKQRAGAIMRAHQKLKPSHHVHYST
jgi:hypothetical protein